MLKYVQAALGIIFVVWWAIHIFMHIGTRTLLAFIGLVASIVAFILAVTFFGQKAGMIIVIAGFVVILSLVALFIFFWMKDSKEQAGRIYRKENR